MAPSYGSIACLTAYTKDSPAEQGISREGTVSSELRDLHAQLQALDDATGKLRSRLDGLIVDRPRVASGQPGPPCNPVDRCKIAGEVHAAVDLACNITAKVTDMLCCLEI